MYHVIPQFDASIGHKKRLISLSRTDIFENMREKLLIKSNF